ncbi:unnamed protein product [Phytophthora fragariaefolia]|uniref:Unnamed protein product n=1 Tax=Phytophthora fragariaefolia TaxID=1490495 RepID=A0A9W6YM59_9STRA|nr:unnamed protein product [Phytophthora fragariaefolia]
MSKVPIFDQALTTRIPEEINIKYQRFTNRVANWVRSCPTWGRRIKLISLPVDGDERARTSKTRSGGGKHVSASKARRRSKRIASQSSTQAAAFAVLGEVLREPLNITEARRSPQWSGIVQYRRRCRAGTSTSIQRFLRRRYSCSFRMNTPTTQAAGTPAASAAANTVVASSATTGSSPASTSVVTSTMTTPSPPKRTMSLGEYKKARGNTVYLKDLILSMFCSKN